MFTSHSAGAQESARCPVGGRFGGAGGGCGAVGGGARVAVIDLPFVLTNLSQSSDAPAAFSLSIASEEATKSSPRCWIASFLLATGMALWCKSWTTCSNLNGGPLRKGSLVFPVAAGLGAIRVWAKQAHPAVKITAVHKAETEGLICILFDRVFRVLRRTDLRLPRAGFGL